MYENVKKVLAKRQRRKFHRPSVSLNPFAWRDKTKFFNFIEKFFKMIPYESRQISSLPKRVNSGGYMEIPVKFFNKVNFFGVL